MIMANNIFLERSHIMIGARKKAYIYGEIAYCPVRDNISVTEK
jgi:hypothetical protein